MTTRRAMTGRQLFISERIVSAAVLCAVALCVWHAGVSSQPEAAAEERVEEPKPISAYDDIMRTVGGEYGLDWRLLSAIAHTESRFNPSVVSPRGAVGLMQIMPSVGVRLGVAGSELSEPENNVRVAAMLLKRIESKMKLPPELPDEDRLAIVLACYHGGSVCVNEARCMARSRGEEADSWSVVSRCLMQKSRSSGRRTVSYVRSVMKRYDDYCSESAVRD